MWRVLQPGGRAVLLEFGMPSAPGLRSLYRFYFTCVMPLAASILSRDRSGAYRYLPQSVLSFPGRAGVVASLRRVGFAAVDVVPLTLGIVSVYRARK
jgi:demethylmenaquinone methyltransferase/2-methoxy-6-polyprenyl-1,4-benzoquinol methylase